MNKENTEDIELIQKESIGAGKLSIKPMADLIQPQTLSLSPPQSPPMEYTPTERTINGRRFVITFCK